MAAARGDAPSVAARAAALDRLASAVAALAGAARAAAEAAHQLKRADDELAGAAVAAGFASAQDAAAVLLPRPERERLEQRLDRHRAELAAAERRLAEPEPAEAAARPPADLPGTRAALGAATDRLRAAHAARDAARVRCEALAAIGRQLAELARSLAPELDRYARISRLAALAAGTSADNRLRMRLESYVLAARLEQVAAAASDRLVRMSGGRYTLVHSDGRGTGNKRSGLALRVVDAWTGTERDTATLSGGESFFASLALALGLADVVTDEAGGMPLDTLFIDEGFGSLDEHTLEEVMDVLDGLRERDRAVGIVSHVADLRSRIPAQLLVRKGRHGSTLALAGREDA
ncbi:SbcC/MukB-like Walker B domain-containing protein [Kitasatospora purpeofusca]|uniref:SbcC/MukB-like Walker B domain-containing protein n=1 Tax=Kitasatospora purpeofusca TaxID=67352 RepID=UPI0036D338E2